MPSVTTPSSAARSPAPQSPASEATPIQPRASATAASTVRFNTLAVVRDMRRLAEAIGPREATSRNFAEAADLVEERFEDLGYRVRRTRVPVPAGNSWGSPVPRGTSLNVLAAGPGFDPRQPHVVIGAHLDTVPVSPGAEDNASGVAVMLELARMASVDGPGLPVQFIAFGAEEPRGNGDAWHHFGSRRHVADLPGAHRRAVHAMVSLDRVGVRAGYIPVCSAGPAGTDLRAQLRAAARRLRIPTRPCLNRSSDHWSFEKAGIPAARLGSIPYAGYHSSRDVLPVIDRRQLDRVGRLMEGWLQGLN